MVATWSLPESSVHRKCSPPQSLGQQLLAAHGLNAHRGLLLDAGDCSGQGYALLPESVSWWATGWFKNTKIWLSSFQMGQLLQATPAPKHHMEWAEASVTFASVFRSAPHAVQSWLPSGNISLEHSPVNLLHAILWLELCFQGIPSKKPYDFMYIFPKYELGSS